MVVFDPKIWTDEPDDLDETHNEPSVWYGEARDFLSFDYGLGELQADFDAAMQEGDEGEEGDIE